VKVQQSNGILSKIILPLPLDVILQTLQCFAVNRPLPLVYKN